MNQQLGHANIYTSSFRVGFRACPLLVRGNGCEAGPPGHSPHAVAAPSGSNHTCQSKVTMAWRSSVPPSAPQATLTQPSVTCWIWSLPSPCLACAAAISAAQACALVPELRFPDCVVDMCTRVDAAVAQAAERAHGMFLLHPPTTARSRTTPPRLLLSLRGVRAGQHPARSRAW